MLIVDDDNSYPSALLYDGVKTKTITELGGLRPLIITSVICRCFVIENLLPSTEVPWS